jgi:hypothetical protein
MAICPNCGNQTGEGAIFCDQCGTRIPQPEAAVSEPALAPAGGSVICPACGAGNVPGEMFCDFCGSPLEPPVPTVEEVADLEPVSSEAELEVEVAPSEPVAAEAAARAEAEAMNACPSCGAEVLPGEAFCADCGASLAQPPIPPEPVPKVEPEVEPEPSVDAVVAEVSTAEEVAAEPEAEELVAEAAPPVPAPAGPPTCPACGTEVEEGDTFCSTCGYALKPVPAAVPATEAPAPAPSAPAPAGPRLVVAASGAEIPLQAGEELFVGREDPVSGVYPDVDLTPHGGEDGGVSRRHARLIVEGGSYFVEDLDSTNFTFVNKKKVAPKTRQQVQDGDEIRFGRVALIFRS